MPIHGFDSVHLVNLDRMPERLEAFNQRFQSSGWPFQTPRRFAAVDGSLLPTPVGFTQQPGAWGCLQSHMTLWREAAVAGKNLFVFEDDCIFRDDFDGSLGPFLSAVPDDWDMIYLGGLHRYTVASQHEKIADNCYRAWGVTGTWSYAVSARFAPVILQWFIDQPMREMNHLDQMLCFYHVKYRPKVYIPYPWLCGMAKGVSDICGRDYMNDHWWDWEPGKDSKPYFAMSKVSSVRFADGQQIGDGHFRSGFDPDMTRFTRVA